MCSCLQSFILRSLLSVSYSPISHFATLNCQIPFSILNPIDSTRRFYQHSSFPFLLSKWIVVLLQLLHAYHFRLQYSSISLIIYQSLCNPGAFISTIFRITNSEQLKTNKQQQHYSLCSQTENNFVNFWFFCKLESLSTTPPCSDLQYPTTLPHPTSNFVKWMKLCYFVRLQLQFLFLWNFLAISSISLLTWW